MTNWKASGRLGLLWHTNKMDNLITRVKEIYKEYVPGHDVKHTLRVAGLAKKIAVSENYDVDEAVAAALLHDIGRTCELVEELHAEASLEMARETLNECTNFSQDTIARIIDAVAQHSNKTSTGKLANILQDADKLDGIGAIGVARAYISKSHVDDYLPELMMEDYNDGRKVNSLVAQLRLQMEWFDMLYTKTAKEMASRRIDYMRGFLKELERDILEASN